MANLFLEYDHSAPASLDDQPNYQKRRRPARNSFKPAVRRALSQSYRRGNPPSSLPTGGFHRRIFKKPSIGIG